MPRKSKPVKKSPKPKPSKSPERIEEDYEQALIDRISRANTIIQEVQSAPGWRIYLDDVRRSVEMADDNWHLVTKPEALQEMRITKLAAKYAMDVVSHYASDLEKAKKELETYRDPKNQTQKDYDTEGTN